MHISVDISQILTIDQLFISYGQVNERIHKLLVVVVKNKPSAPPLLPALYHLFIMIWSLNSEGVGALWSETGGGD